MALSAVAAIALLATLSQYQSASAEPVLHDDGLVLETYASGACCGVTTMDFVGQDDILVLQKGGKVRLIRDGVLRSEPVLVVDTDPIREMGLLGIEAVNSTVYLYYTATDGNRDPISNRIYKYSWNGHTLTDPVLVKELPANLYHNGGAMISDADGQVYAVIGDTGRYGPLQNKKLENLFPPGITDYLDTSSILRVDPEGPYFAVGIRNSFGLAIDPVTGNMWATENGDDDYDEVNMVPDGFNSGWQRAMGPATEEELARMVGYEGYEYQDPKFSWYRTVAPAGIGFANFAETDEYNDSIFVGDCNNSRLYRFQLNPERDGFVFSSPGLQDGVADDGDPLDEIIVGDGFGCITSIRTGPDGYLYLASHIDNNIYRILPVEAAGLGETPDAPGGGCLIATAAYGAELASQVQMLREVRDGRLLSTSSGAAFMSVFEPFYYSFSPAVADLERENPVLREATRYAITPMLHSLSLLSLADEGSELQILALGSAVILLNVGLYVAAPVAAALCLLRLPPWIGGRTARQRTWHPDRDPPADSGNRAA